MLGASWGVLALIVGMYARTSVCYQWFVVWRLLHGAAQCCLLKVQRHEKADMAFQVLYYFTTNKKRQSHVRIKYYIKHNSD